MLVAFYCALALLSMTYVVMTCFNFRKKKTECPYAPSKSRTPQAAGKSRSDTHATTSKIKTPTPATRRSRWSRSKLSTVKGSSTFTASTVHSAAGTATSQSADQVRIPLRSDIGSSLSADVTLKRKQKRKPRSSSTEGGSLEIKEDLGDIQLVRPKAKRRDVHEMIRRSRALEIKSSEEDPSESTRSTDDTLNGVESLKTDNLTSLAPRTSKETLSREVKRTQTTSDNFR